MVEKKDINPADTIRMMIGKELKDTSDRFVMKKTDKPVKLSVKNLCRKGVFRDISFDVHQGEILGIGGLVGSGRTEVLRCIYGIDKYDLSLIHIYSFCFISFSSYMFVSSSCLRNCNYGVPLFQGRSP